MASTKLALVARLRSQAGVTALLGAPPATRLHPADAMPSPVDYPYLTYRLASEVRPKLLDGMANHGIATFELSCWGKGDASGYAQADELGMAVVAALDGETWSAEGVRVQYGSIEDGADAGEPPAQGKDLGDACAQLQYKMVFVEE